MSKVKSEILGENFSTASSRLRKSILFELAKKLNMTRCFRCSEDIADLRQFSIEHKVSWQTSDDPSRSFYDIDNIAFSHLSCNSRASVSPLQKYGSRKEYSKANWDKYYERHREEVLERKRLRYRMSRVDKEN